MDTEGRDRRDWPASDSPGDPSDATDETIRPAGEPIAYDPTAPIGWTSADASLASDPGREPAPEGAAEIEAAPAPVTPDETRSWPTEPPAAGSGGPDVWPTSAPERSDANEEPTASSEASASEYSTAANDEPGWPSADAAAVEPQSTPAAGEWSATEPIEAEPAASEPPPSEIEAHTTATRGDETDIDRADALAGAAAAAAAPAAVPDAEAAVGESTLCPRCGTENRPGLAFCRNCGQRLVAAGVATTVERPGAPEGSQACPRCGTHNRAGVAFCQNCGANLRGTAPGYVPPVEAAPDDRVALARERAGAVLGPVVLLIGLLGLATGYLLPFLYGDNSLFDRAFGAGGYGPAFWSGYPEVGANLADQAYFGLAAPVPLLGVLLLVLAVAGFVRARPGGLQTVGLVIALIWSVGLAVLFLVVEVAGNWDGDIVGLLRVLTPAGIIFFLASLIVLIGVLTRFGRS